MIPPASSAAILRPDAVELSVIVPTFNERENIAALTENLAHALQDCAWEVIFVDDNSTDGTADVICQIARDNPRVRRILRIGRRGLSGAIIEGMLASTAPCIAIMDGDLQHDATLLPRMLAVLRSDIADLVVGSRYADGGSTGAFAGNLHARVHCAEPVAADRIGLAHVHFQAALAKPYPLVIPRMPPVQRERNPQGDDLDPRKRQDHPCAQCRKRSRDSKRHDRDQPVDPNEAQRRDRAVALEEQAEPGPLPLERQFLAGNFLAPAVHGIVVAAPQKKPA